MKSVWTIQYFASGAILLQLKQHLLFSIEIQVYFSISLRRKPNSYCWEWVWKIHVLADSILHTTINRQFWQITKNSTSKTDFLWAWTARTLMAHSRNFSSSRVTFTRSWRNLPSCTRSWMLDSSRRPVATATAAAAREDKRLPGVCSNWDSMWFCSHTTDLKTKNCGRW